MAPKSALKAAFKSVFKKNAPKAAAKPSKNPSKTPVKHAGPTKVAPKAAAKKADPVSKKESPKKTGVGTSHAKGAKPTHGQPAQSHKSGKNQSTRPVVASQAKTKDSVALRKSADGGAKKVSDHHVESKQSHSTEKTKDVAPQKKPSKKGPPSLAKQIESRMNARDRLRDGHHGGPICREVACELMATTLRYCRLHYIKNWKKVKRKELILKEKKLDSYIEELVAKYPEKYIEAIRQDLSSEKDFAKVVSELEIEDFTAEEYDAESAAEAAVEDIIDTTKRTDFDDEDEFGF